MTHKKFGLRHVRPPVDVLDALREEHRDNGKQGTMYYRVDRIGSRGPQQYVVYLCNRNGDRLRGATKHPFDPIRYERRPRPVAAAARPAPTVPPPAETTMNQCGKCSTGTLIDHGDHRDCNNPDCLFSTHSSGKCPSAAQVEDKGSPIGAPPPSAASAADEGTATTTSGGDGPVPGGSGCGDGFRV